MQELEFLGYILTAPGRISICPKRLAEMEKEYLDILRSPMFGPLHRFVSKLFHLSKVIIGARQIICNLMRAMPSLAVNMESAQKEFLRVAMSKAFKQDFKKAWYLCNNCRASYRPMIHQTTLEVATDASMDQAGISSTDGKHTRVLPLSGELWDKLGIRKEDPIVMKELYAVCKAVELCPREVNLRILCDNMNVIQQIPKGGKYDTSKAYENCHRYLRSTSANKNITLVVNYVSTERNPADAPSRQQADDSLPQDATDIFQESVEPITREQAVEYHFGEFTY